MVFALGFCRHAKCQDSTGDEDAGQVPRISDLGHDLTTHCRPFLSLLALAPLAKLANMSDCWQTIPKLPRDEDNVKFKSHRCGHKTSPNAD